MDLRIGSLCTGYGGLDMAVQAVFGGTVAWHSQYDPDDHHQYAAQILEHHWPEIPNHGDITKVDFAAVEPVDILTAGFPCQPFSLAGLQLGHQDERWLWDDVARAIRDLRPSLVLLENVPGMFTAPGRQPDCVCGWNLRWGRQLGHLLHDHERPDQVLANDDRADGEAARAERPVGDARGTVGPGGPTRPGTGLGGDAALGTVGQRRAVPVGDDASLPAGEEGPGEAGCGDAWPRVAGFDEWARNLLDAGGIGAVAEGEGADSGVEPSRNGGGRWGDCPACGRSMDDPASRFVRRAVGDVLGSLSSLGFDAQWITFRAADVGAPHQRRRAFFLAWPADPQGAGRAGAGVRGRAAERGAAPADTPGVGEREPADEAHAIAGSRDAREVPGGRGGTPVADSEGQRHRHSGAPGERGLPAPAVTGDPSPGAEGDPAADADGYAVRKQSVAVTGRGSAAVAGLADADADAHANGGGLPGNQEPPVGRDAVRQRVRDHADGRDDAPAHTEGDGRHEGRTEPARQLGRPDTAECGTPGVEWGPYGAAVARWERTLGRPAPRPTDALGRLSPAFVEWMQGLDAGHVTDVPGLPRGAQLKALGNGVVPQQAEAAIRLLLARVEQHQAVA